MHSSSGSEESEEDDDRRGRRGRTFGVIFGDNYGALKKIR